MTQAWVQQLVNLGACTDAIFWAQDYPSLRAAWAACERPDWMLWLIGRTTSSAPWSDERKPLVRVAAEIVALAPPCTDEFELARQWCIDATLRWCDGNAERDEVEAARYAAAAAAYAAAYAAANAAAADDAANAAAYAAYAAAADAYAAAADAYAEARLKFRQTAANIVRLHYPHPPRITRVAL